MSTTDSPPPPSGPAAPAPAGPSSPGPTGSGPRVSGHEARNLGGLRRTTKANPEGRHIAGVAGGLARHFDIDPVIVRVLLVVLVFFGGAGLLLYGAGWLLVPEEGRADATISLDERNRSLALYVAGGLAALALLGDAVGSYDFPWPLAIIALILLVVLGNRDRIKDPDWRPLARRQGDAPPAPAATPGEPGTEATAPGGEPPYGPTYAAPAYVPRPNPRRRGPILFWFTLALIALGLGTLGIVDAAPGTSIPGSAYPALAVGITGAMLVLGAFWGRAGGLILVGLVSTLALVGSTAHSEYGNDAHRVHAAPASAAAVASDYRMDVGELVLDLTHVGGDATALDGRTIRVHGGVGKLSVVVPDDWGVHADTNVGVGNARVLTGGESGGFGISRSGSESGEPGTPDVRFDISLGVGAVQVLRASDFPWPDHHFSGWSSR